MSIEKAEAMASWLVATKALLVLIPVLNFVAVASAGSFYQDVDVTWGDGRGRVVENGQTLTLSLDKTSGSGFQSKSEYLFARIDMQLKLVRGNSAGTVTTYYLSSQGANHDEIDIEFLGNLTGDPYVMHTNVYANGQGNREQQFYLWFDPTADFHTYSIVWNQQRILFMVDGTPIREFKNHEERGIPFPSRQPMKVYGSLWDAEDWATRGGLVKTDWSQAPFMAYFRSYNAVPSSASTAGGNYQQLDSGAQSRMKWARDKYMIYDYCKDAKRFPQGLPLECSLQ